jgi:hypothetical protein
MTWGIALSSLPVFDTSCIVNIFVFMVWWQESTDGVQNFWQQTGRFNDLASASLTINLQGNDVYHCLGADEVSGEYDCSSLLLVMKVMV